MFGMVLTGFSFPFSNGCGVIMDHNHASDELIT